MIGGGRRAQENFGILHPLDWLKLHLRRYIQTTHEKKFTLKKKFFFSHVLRDTSFIRNKMILIEF